MNYYEMLLARKLAKGELPPNAYLLKTASGSLISFSDGADLPMPSFICNISAQQDLHGYDAPWVGGAGKNKFDSNSELYLGFGTIAVDESGSFSSGNYRASVIPINGNDYVLSGLNFDAVTDEVLRLFLCNDYPAVGVNCSRIYNLFRNQSFRITNNYNYLVILYRWRDTATETDKNSAQIEYGTTATSFAPYENICPISGHTGVEAVISPTTEASAGTTIAVSWQTEAGEVYGGYVDLVSGELTVTHKYMDFDGTERWSLGTSTVWYTISDMNLSKSRKGWCNYFPVKTDSSDTRTILMVQFGSDSKENRFYLVNAYENGYDEQAKIQALVTGMQIVYPLAEPLVIQLTPQQIKSLLGKNNAWCSTGDVDLQYFGKGAE